MDPDLEFLRSWPPRDTHAIRGWRIARDEWGKPYWVGDRAQGQDWVSVHRLREMLEWGMGPSGLRLAFALPVNTAAHWGWAYDHDARIWSACTAATGEPVWFSRDQMEAARRGKVLDDVPDLREAFIDPTHPRWVEIALLLSWTPRDACGYAWRLVAEGSVPHWFGEWEQGHDTVRACTLADALAQDDEEWGSRTPHVRHCFGMPNATRDLRAWTYGGSGDGPPYHWYGGGAWVARDGTWSGWFSGYAVGRARDGLGAAELVAALADPDAARNGDVTGREPAAGDTCPRCGETVRVGVLAVSTYLRCGCP